MTALAAGWQHQFVQTNGIRLHCVCQGEGELVILLHGFPEFWYSWRHQIPVLAKHFKVVAPDLRGYNDSDKPDSGYDIDTLMADVRGLITALGYAKAHIVAHDWGGVIAWHLAQRFPQVVNRLAVLNCPHPQRLFQELVTNLDQLRRSWYFLGFQVPWLPEWLIHRNLDEFVRRVFQEQAIRKGAFSSRDIEIYQAALAKPGVLTAAINYYRAAFSLAQLPKLFSQVATPITAPTLLLWGEDDFALSKTLTEDTERFVHAPFLLKFISQCGHWIQQEAPQTVNRELLTFLRAEEALKSLEFR